MLAVREFKGEFERAFIFSTSLLHMYISANVPMDLDACEDACCLDDPNYGRGGRLHRF